MGWIAVLFIGLTLGWALELLLDFWYWGRRNRKLSATLTNCHQSLQSSEKKIGEIQAILSLYQAKEDDYQKCQIDHAILAEKHHSLETQIENLTAELQTSEKSVDQLNLQVLELKLERDELHNSLEEVDHWVESSMRRRVFDTRSLGSTFNRSKDQTVAYARSVTAIATSHIGRTTGQISNMVSTGKKKIGQFWPNRWLSKVYCSAWAMIRIVNKKAAMPLSCSIETK